MQKIFPSLCSHYSPFSYYEHLASHNLTLKRHGWGLLLSFLCQVTPLISQNPYVGRHEQSERIACYCHSVDRQQTITCHPVYRLYPYAGFRSLQEPHSSSTDPLSFVLDIHSIIGYILSFSTLTLLKSRRNSLHKTLVSQFYKLITGRSLFFLLYILTFSSFDKRSFYSQIEKELMKCS